MYKLMLVDDEDMIRKEVVNKVDWMDYGFEIVCEAENGIEAYDKFLQYEPDVVITDIKMPFMDGLVLAEKILEHHPFTKVIVLTGFDDFDYARKSVELHLMHYVLKPVSMKELIAILKKVKEAIDTEIEEKRNISRLKAHYEESFPFMRQRFLVGLIEGHYQTEAISRGCDYYQIQLRNEGCCVVVVHLDEQTVGMLESERHMRLLALYEQVKDLDQSHPIGIYFMMHDHVVLIASDKEKQGDGFKREYLFKLERLRQSMSRFHQATVTIGIGRVVGSAVQIPMSYTSALSALDYKLMLGSNRIIDIQDIEPVQDLTLVFGDHEQQNLKRIMKVGTSETFEAYINQLFENHHLVGCEKGVYQVFILELVTTMIKTMKDLLKEQDPYQFKEVDLFDVVLKSQSLEFVKNSILVLGKDMMKKIAENKAHTTNRLVQDSQNYVRQHYQDWDLTVDQIAADLHYSPNYLSSVFKKETGQSFMNYLLSVRLEAAKELLETTDLKNYEVAVEVGFSSANYFSYCFKKTLGLSPTQYKKKGIQR